MPPEPTMLRSDRSKGYAANRRLSSGRLRPTSASMTRTTDGALSSIPSALNGAACQGAAPNPHRAVPGTGCWWQRAWRCRPFREANPGYRCYDSRSAMRRANDVGPRASALPFDAVGSSSGAPRSGKFRGITPPVFGARTCANADYIAADECDSQTTSQTTQLRATGVPFYCAQRARRTLRAIQPVATLSARLPWGYGRTSGILNIGRGLDADLRHDLRDAQMVRFGYMPMFV